MKGAELRRIRERLGLTQKELAEEIGAHPNTVAKWERDEVGMRPSTERLVRLLGGQDRQKKKKAK